MASFTSSFSFSYPCKAAGEKYELRKMGTGKEPGEVTVDTDTDTGTVNHVLEYEMANQVANQEYVPGPETFQRPDEAPCTGCNDCDDCVQAVQDLAAGDGLFRNVSSQETFDAANFLQTIADDAFNHKEEGYTLHSVKEVRFVGTFPVKSSIFLSHIWGKNPSAFNFLLFHFHQSS